MSPVLALSVLIGYFALLITISFVVGKKGDNNSFFIGERKSPWYLVAFGMIGASLSGVTFISVPGWVRESGFSYMQMVFGYFFGYMFIAHVLMPIYYKWEVTSIYSYLKDRMGNVSYKTGSAFFLISRTIGASFRLYLVAMVLDIAIFGKWGVPFSLTVFLTILLIWLYTFRSGIKSIVWTDSLQTIAMLTSVVIAIVVIINQLDWSFSEAYTKVVQSDMSQIFFWEGRNHFIKNFLAGIFIAIVMTGLDQDMMQKNLSCKNIGDAQKNMKWFSVVLIFVNMLFMVLGVLLYLFAEANQLTYVGDQLFPSISLFHLNDIVGVIFLVGVIAAAYSSADSALTALTTAFCIDFLGFEEKKIQNSKESIRTRYAVHIGFSFILFLTVIGFKLINDDSVIKQIFTFAGYTYGPLLGLFFYGIYTNLNLKDKYVWIVCIMAPILSHIIKIAIADYYVFNFEFLLLNGFITFIGLLLITKK